MNKSIANGANIGYVIFFMLIDKWGILVSFVAIYIYFNKNDFSYLKKSNSS